jgi:hypothetical protein
MTVSASTVIATHTHRGDVVLMALDPPTGRHPSATSGRGQGWTRCNIQSLPLAGPQDSFFRAARWSPQQPFGQRRTSVPGVTEGLRTIGGGIHLDKRSDARAPDRQRENVARSLQRNRHGRCALNAGSHVSFPGLVVCLALAFGAHFGKWNSPVRRADGSFAAMIPHSGSAPLNWILPALRLNAGSRAAILRACLF